MACPAVYVDAADLNSGCGFAESSSVHSYAMGCGSQTQVDKLGKKHLYP